MSQAQHIFVVDDEAANRDLLRDLLGGLGFETTATGEAAVALAACADGVTEAVLLDLRMPGQDGFALAPRLRAAGRRPLAIVAMSASVYPVDREQAIGAGCDEFVPKPIRETELFAVLGRLLGLEWTHADGAAPTRDSQTPFDLLPLPELAALDELLALAECGDVLKLTEILKSLRVADPKLAPFVSRIDALAASYQMRALSDALKKARKVAAGAGERRPYMHP